MTVSYRKKKACLKAITYPRKQRQFIVCWILNPLLTAYIHALQSTFQITMLLSTDVTTIKSKSLYKTAKVDNYDRPNILLPPVLEV